MKKTRRILTGTMLGIVFIAAVGFGINQYSKEWKNKRDSESEAETIKQPKLKIPERKNYELGEEAECEGLIWTITSAEVIDYKDVDDYYKARGNLWNPSEDVPRYGSEMFAEEVQYLLLKGTVKNPSERTGRTYHLSKMEVLNLSEDGTSEIELSHYISMRPEECIGLPPQKNSMGIDGRCISKTGEAKELASMDDAFIIEAQETLEIEYIMAFSKYCKEIEGTDLINYDFYLSVESLIPDISVNYTGINRKIHLGIEQTNAINSYDRQRDIPKMKCRQWTNLEMKQYQDNGYPVLYEYTPEGEIQIGKEAEEKVVDESYKFGLHSNTTTQVTGANTVNWEELPAGFTGRGELQNMAERYQQKFGYKREDLKILLLDIRVVSWRENNRYNFYENTYLFTRDEAGRRWIFGTADDWMIIENNQKNGHMGHINTEWMKNEQILTFQAAYLLPPEIYSQKELYFCGGGLIEKLYI